MSKYTSRGIIAGLVAGVLLIGGINRAVQAQSFLYDTSDDSTPDEVPQLALVEKRDVENTIQLTGAIASAREKTIAVNAVASNLIVKEICVKVGDSVQKGDVLFTLNTTQLEKTLAQTEEKLAVLERRNELNDTKETQEKNDLEITNEIDERIENRSIDTEINKVEDYYIEYTSQLNDLYNKYGIEDQAYYEALEAQSVMDDARIVLEDAIDDQCVSVEELNYLKEIYNKTVESFNAAVGAYEAAIAASISAENSARKSASTIYNAENELQNKQDALEKNNITRNRKEEDARITHEEKELERSVNDHELLNTATSIREQIAASTVIAPFSGVVTSVNLQIGQIVSKEPVILTDDNNYNIVCDVNEKDIVNIEEGMDVQFTTVTTKNQRISGKVAFVALNPTKQTTSGNSEEKTEITTGGITDKTPALYRVLIKVLGQEQYLRPGMSADITIKTGEAKEVLTVPNDCIKYNEDGYTAVYVTTDAGTTEKEVVVSTGLTDGKFTEVDSPELSEGMQIVVPKKDGYGVESE